jgi:GH24 family phage-related lysozyme (muramidase)
MRLDYDLTLPTEDPLALAEELAKPFESCDLRAYFDPVAFDRWKRPAGYPTQGWGHLLVRKTKQVLMQEQGLDFMSRYDHDDFDERLKSMYPDWTQDQADAQLRRDMLKALNAVNRLCKVPLSPAQLAALVDFAFNLGAGALQASTLLRLVNRGELADAADQFLRWNKAGGVTLRGLTRRCAARRALFLSTL